MEILNIENDNCLGGEYMAGKFSWTRFADVNIEDDFFDSLKRDYVEFCDWFHRKSSLGEKALVYKEDNSIGAFIYLKRKKNQ